MSTDLRQEDVSAFLDAASTTEISPTVEVDPQAQVLPDTTVTLPGGFLTEDFQTIYDVEVRELNGLDEEAIARAAGIGRALQVILERGTVAVGGQKVTKDMLEMMLMGDRDAVLLGIRKATYGDEVKYDVTCPECDTEQEHTISLTDDVKVERLSAPEDRYFDVPLRNGGSVSVSLPDGKTHREMLNTTDRSLAEINTLLLAGCISSVNGMPSTGRKTALGLGILDREKITEEIAKRQCGPKWDAVVRNCEGCEEEVVLPISLAALFRF